MTPEGPDREEAPVPLMTVDEVAAWLRVSEKTVRKLASDGDLPGRKIGREWRFDRSEVAAWLHRQQGDGDR
jgi:excisionase family DNA binding protein